ncbi:hypothetical protein D3C75_937790 [compost metagenome]
MLETNLAVHRNYGVPYLPGTALKGLAAHYASEILGEKHSGLRKDGQDYAVLFGHQENSGFIRFHDALITPDTAEASFRHDVLTPHHQNYNGSLSSDKHPAPRDDDSPSPIPFLTAAGDFRIALSCEGFSEDTASWLKLAQMILSAALQHEGIGAKTSVGYGRMQEVAES